MNKFKKISKRIGFGLLGFVLLVVIIGSCSIGSDSTKKNDVVKTEVKKEPVKTPEEPKKEEPVAPEPQAPAPEPVKPAPIPAPKQEVKADPQVVLSLLQENFKGTAKVTYNEEMKAFMITPTDPAFAREVVQTMQGNLPKTNWDKMVSSFSEMSKTVGAEYLIVLVNPVNQDRYLLIVGNGVVLYDALNAK